MAINNETLKGKLAGQALQQQGENMPAALTAHNMATYLNAYKPQFEKALANVMDGDKFVRMLLTEVRGNKSLMEVAIRNPSSLLASALEAAALGLDFSVQNEVFLVPFGQEIACITGYKGLMKLASQAAIDAGAPLTALSADEICENDLYERERGSNPHVVHKLPKFGTPRGKTLGYVAIAKDSAGRIAFVEMTVEEMTEHKKRFMRSKSGQFAKAENDDAYGRKTVLRLLINRYLNMSAKLSRAMTMLNRADQAAEKGTTIATEAIINVTDGVNYGKENSGSEGFREEGGENPQAERKLQEGA